MSIFPIPEVLQPEIMVSRLQCRGMISKLDSLAERGIILNTWQAAELYGEGNRGLGKTYLSFVQAAEDSLETGGMFCIGNTDIDPDATTFYRKREWLKAFAVFVKAHYSDVFRVKTSSSDYTVVLELRVPKYTKRWWNT